MEKVRIGFVIDLGIAEVTIDPSQFVMEKTESIYKNYSLKEKIGEGNAAKRI